MVQLIPNSPQMAKQTRKLRCLIARISAIQTTVPVELCTGIAIHATPPRVATFLEKAYERRWTRHPSVYKYCLLIRDVAVTDEEEYWPVEEAVLRLRLLKGGNLAFNLVLEDDWGWLDYPEPRGDPLRVPVPVLLLGVGTSGATVDT